MHVDELSEQAEVRNCVRSIGVRVAQRQLFRAITTHSCKVEEMRRPAAGRRCERSPSRAQRGRAAAMSLSAD